MRSLKLVRFPIAEFSSVFFERAVQFALPAVALICATAWSLAVMPQFATQNAQERLADKSVIDGSLQEEFDLMFSQQGIAYQLFRDVLGMLRMRLFGQTRYGVLTSDTGWMFNLHDFVPPDPAMRHRAVDLVIDAHTELTGKGTKVVVVFAPYKAEVMGHQLNIKVVSDTLRSARMALKAELEAAGVAVLDPTEAAIAASVYGDVGIKTDQHWSPFGARTVAAFVAANLGREVLDPADSIELKDRRPVTFQGDLASAIGSPQASEAAGVLTEVIRPTVAVLSNGDLVDPDWTKARTVVIGTSASANPYWGFVSSLSFEFQQPVANMAISAAGPFYPMNLARQQFEAAGHYPERVIWEITLPSIYNPHHLDALGPERSGWH